MAKTFIPKLEKGERIFEHLIIKKDYLSKISFPSILLTNKRIVYPGSFLRRFISIPLENIISADYLSRPYHSFGIIIIKLKNKKIKKIKDFSRNQKEISIFIQKLIQSLNQVNRF